MTQVTGYQGCGEKLIPILGGWLDVPDNAHYLGSDFAGAPRDPRLHERIHAYPEVYRVDCPALEGNTTESLYYGVPPDDPAHQRQHTGV